MLCHQQHDHVTLIPCNCDNQSMSYLFIYFAVIQYKHTENDEHVCMFIRLCETIREYLYCMYVCMFVVCMCVCIYINYVHMYVCTYVCMYICMYVHM